MEDRDLEILSAFIDGEAVNTAHLLEVLEEPAGHAALLDFLRLRETVERDPRRPSPALVAAVDERRARRLPWWRRPVPMAVPAAAAVLLAFVFSLWVFWKALPPEGPSVSKPPVPSRVLYFQQGVDWNPEGR